MSAYHQFDAVLCSFMGNKNSDVDHMKFLHGLNLGCIFPTLVQTKQLAKTPNTKKFNYETGSIITWFSYDVYKEGSQHVFHLWSLFLLDVCWLCGICNAATHHQWLLSLLLTSTMNVNTSLTGGGCNATFKGMLSTVLGRRVLILIESCRECKFMFSFFNLDRKSVV